jgi:hypothetical protein
MKPLPPGRHEADALLPWFSCKSWWIAFLPDLGLKKKVRRWPQLRIKKSKKKKDFSGESKRESNRTRQQQRMREQQELQHMIQDIAGDNPYQAVRSPWNEGMDLSETETEDED